MDFDYDVDFDDQHDPGKTLIDFPRDGTKGAILQLGRFIETYTLNAVQCCVYYTIGTARISRRIIMQ
jgi:hypothetical protein